MSKDIQYNPQNFRDDTISEEKLNPNNIFDPISDFDQKSKDNLVENMTHYSKLTGSYIDYITDSWKHRNLQKTFILVVAMMVLLISTCTCLSILTRVASGDTTITIEPLLTTLGVFITSVVTIPNFITKQLFSYEDSEITSKIIIEVIKKDTTKESNYIK